MRKESAGMTDQPETRAPTAEEISAYLSAHPEQAATPSPASPPPPEPPKPREPHLTKDGWWMVPEGTSLTATLTGAKSVERYEQKSGQMRTVLVLTLRAEDGREGPWWAWQRVADGKLRQLRPKRGEQLYIENQGIAAGKDYGMWEIRCPDRPDDDTFSDVWGSTPSAPRSPAPAQPVESDLPVDDSDLPWSPNYEAPEQAHEQELDQRFGSAMPE
jgi:hypothetical protein